MIKAPYNFVPLNEKIFFPDNWSTHTHKISHDIPFAEHLSGTIGITVNSESPLFIRNHGVDELDQKNTTEFCHHLENGTKKYYIPSTTMKGMVRSVLEIMSFSRIETQDKTFSYRDIDNFEYKNRLISHQRDIQCGWLYKENNHWKIIELGDAKQLKKGHNELADVLDDRSVLEFKGNRLRPEQKYKMYGYDVENLKTRSGGVAVFTGTINPKEDKEYMFPLPEKKHNDLAVDEIAKQTFKDAYNIGQPETSKVWKAMWEKEFNQDRFVPIFYLKEKSVLKHFGLSLLYKLPYANSVFQGIGKHNQELEKLDLAETIFGFTRSDIDDEKKKNLKGRVSFSHCKAQEQPKPMAKVTKVLSTPRAGYYPTYVEQESPYKHVTMDNEFKISGWKRYPIHEKSDTSSVKPNNTTTSFNPLPSNTKFEGKMRFHNLRKFELGALLSALTLHGNNNSFLHSIGMAKPYGFGKIKIHIDMDHKLYIDTVKAYEAKMEEWTKNEDLGSWINSEQIMELFTMMKASDDKKLEYVGFKEYGEIKKSKPLRKRYSQMSNFSISLDSFCDGSMESKLVKIALEKKMQVQKEKELQNRISNTPGRNSTEFKNAIKKYVTSNILLPYYDYADFKKVIEGKEDDIVADDIYNAYMDLVDFDAYKAIEKLLLKREKNQASDLELSELYDMLIGFTK